MLMFVPIQQALVSTIMQKQIAHQQKLHSGLYKLLAHLHMCFWALESFPDMILQLYYIA